MRMVGAVECEVGLESVVSLREGKESLLHEP